MKRWDLVDDERLLRMIARGEGWLEISQRFGVTVAACDARWRKIRTSNAPKPTRTARVHQDRKYEYIRPARNPDTPDLSSIKFADHDKHLRLIAEAMQRGEHLPRRVAA